MNLYEVELNKIDEKIEIKKRMISELEEDKKIQESKKINLKYKNSVIRTELAFNKAQKIKLSTFKKKNAKRRKINKKISASVNLSFILSLILLIINIGFVPYGLLLIIISNVISIINRINYNNWVMETKKEFKGVTLIDLKDEISRLEKELTVNQIKLNDIDISLENLYAKFNGSTNDLNDLQQKYNMVLDYYEKAKQIVSERNNGLIENSEIDQEHQNVLPEMISKIYGKNLTKHV